MKKLNLFILGILLVGTVVAGALSLNLINVSEPSQEISPELPGGEQDYFVSFDCGKDSMEITLSKNDALGEIEYEQELLNPMRRICPTEEITNIVDWNSNSLQEDTNTDCKGFTTEKIQECVCKESDQEMNEAKDGCQDIDFQFP